MELIIVGLIIWAIVHFVNANKEKERNEERQRIAAAEYARRMKLQEREALAAKEKERVEWQRRHELEEAERAIARKAAEEERSRLVAAIASYSPDRLRFEYSKREKAISELKADIREENRQHDEFLASHPDHDHTQAYHVNYERCSKFEAQISALRSEMKLIEAAM